MKENFLKIHTAIKNWITQVFFKRFLTPIVLFVIYFTVLGLTSIVAKIFYKNKLIKNKERKNTNWIETNNYEGNLEDSYRQS